jgi:hypothetical protein
MQLSIMLTLAAFVLPSIVTGTPGCIKERNAAGDNMVDFSKRDANAGPEVDGCGVWGLKKEKRVVDEVEVIQV